MPTVKLSLLALAIVGFAACNSSGSSADTVATAVGDSILEKSNIKTESVSYSADTLQATGFVAYDAAKKSPLPIVVVIPEWWGVNEYPESRAKQLAGLGYFAIVADMYGHGAVAADPKAALAFATPYYMNPALAKSRLEAAVAKAKTYAQADSSKVAAIGYCFGGYVVLNAAKLGSPLKAVVSFHGGLGGAAPIKNEVKAAVLVCQGGDDKFVSPAERAEFKKQMDSVGAPYTFKEYAGATHAFTNPDATANGKKFNMPIAYNAAADTASWTEMKSFLVTAFK